MRKLLTLVAIIAALALPSVAAAGHHSPPVTHDPPECMIPPGANPVYHPCVPCDPNPPAGGLPQYHPPCPPPDPCGKAKD